MMSKAHVAIRGQSNLSMKNEIGTDEEHKEMSKNDDVVKSPQKIEVLSHWMAEVRHKH